MPNGGSVVSSIQNQENSTSRTYYTPANMMESAKFEQDAELQELRAAGRGQANWCKHFGNCTA
jgi:hypothetical protein